MCTTCIEILYVVKLVVDVVKIHYLNRDEVNYICISVLNELLCYYTAIYFVWLLLCSNLSDLYVPWMLKKISKARIKNMLKKYVKNEHTAVDCTQMDV